MPSATEIRGDVDISVIGDPRNWTKRVAITIRYQTTEEYESAVQEWSKEVGNDALHPIPDDASLSFIEYGAEEEHWHLNLKVAERTLDDLADAVQNNRVHSLRVGVSLTNLYTDAGWGELEHEEPVSLFLRPCKRTGGVWSPEFAFGQVVLWELKFAGTAVLNDSFAQEPAPATEAKFTDEPLGPTTADKTLSALERLTADVGAIRSSVIGVGWVIAVALVMSILIGN
jgi:hypothetical protein